MLARKEFLNLVSTATIEKTIMVRVSLWKHITHHRTVCYLKDKGRAEGQNGFSIFIEVATIQMVIGHIWGPYVRVYGTIYGTIC